MTSSTSSPIAPADSPATASASTHRIPTIVHPADGQSVRSFGNEILFKLTAEETAGSFTLGLASVPAGGGPPAHVHDAEDELFLILEGQYRVYVDGEWTDVGPGSAVYLPRGREHTFQVIGATPGRHWVLTTPSGFERYYSRVASLFAAPGAPDGAQLAAINAEHRVRFARVAGAAPVASEPFNGTHME
ncbi:MAG TPA: cupin domain-containing protein [Gemmatimonadaceae bacterium]|nr:cupin domain-containing protein [Gemmatimonadaceae bacterium]